MKYKCLQGTNFLLFFKFVNIETKSRHVQLKINPIVTSNVTHMISLWDSIEYTHPYARFGTSCTYKIIAIKFFPNNHVLSWSFPGGAWCTIFFVLFGNGNVICASRFPPWLSTRVNETNILQECRLHVNESNIGEN